jgi:hypothetical protein
VILLLAYAPLAVAAKLPSDALDPLAPRDDGAGRLTGALSGALILTRDLAGIRRAYVGAAGLDLDGPHTMSAADRKRAAQLWGMPGDLGWQAYTLRRAAVPDAIRVNVLVLDRDTPVVRASYDRTEPGPYALGFPMLSIHAVDRRFLGLGFKRTTPRVSEYTLELLDGSRYGIHEASYETADNTRLVLMSRRDGLPQIGGVDTSTGLGGPAYSSLVVNDLAAMQAFFCNVFDFETRTDREWKIFSPPFRYVTLHGRGSRTGNIGLVEYQKQFQQSGSGVAPRPPHRGLVGWSFPVTSLEILAQRARAQSVMPLAGPIVYRNPALGRIRSLSLLAPNGMLIEAYEAKE